MLRPMLLAVSLVACAREPHSAAEFRRDPAAAERMLAACDSGRRRGEICLQARLGASAAARDRRIETFRRGFE